MTDTELKQMNDQLWKYLVDNMFLLTDIDNKIKAMEDAGQNPAYFVFGEMRIWIDKEMQNGFMKYFNDVQRALIMPDGENLRKKIMERLGRL